MSEERTWDRVFQRNIDASKANNKAQPTVSRLLPADIPTFVVTYGGTGSKMLLTWLYPDENFKFEMPSHLHWRYPPANIQPHQRIIYVFGDPRNAVISFFQRRISRHERHGFRVHPNNLVKYPSWTQKAMENLELDPKPLNPDWGLLEFIQNGEDLYKLEEHLDNWLNCGKNYQVTFVRYETMWEHANLLAKQFGVPAENFPQFIERRANWQSEPEVIGSKLNDIYGSLVRRLDALPDVFLANSNTFTSLVNARS